MPFRRTGVPFLSWPNSVPRDSLARRHSVLTWWELCARRSHHRRAGSAANESEPLAPASLQHGVGSCIRSARTANHESQLTESHPKIPPFLIDICRLEIGVTYWKQTLGVHPNRHGKRGAAIGASQRNMPWLVPLCDLCASAVNPSFNSTTKRARQNHAARLTRTARATIFAANWGAIQWEVSYDGKHS
jgi:hypothetical protein